MKSVGIGWGQMRLELIWSNHMGLDQIWFNQMPSDENRCSQMWLGEIKLNEMRWNHIRHDNILLNKIGQMRPDEVKSDKTRLYLNGWNWVGWDEIKSGKST